MSNNEPHFLGFDLDSEAWIAAGIQQLEAFLAAHAEFVRRYGP